MGTAGYMSPEQARGLSVDTRTDVFSLGVVIYEMVTERMPFEGETPSHLVVSILEKEPPPLTHYLTESPAKLQLIVSKALRKNRDERYQAAELLIDLKILRQELGHDAELGPIKKLIAGSGHLSKRTDKMVSTARRLSLLAAAFVLVISASVWFYISRSRSKSPEPLMKTVVFTSFPGSEVGPAFSPDGNYIAYSWDGEKGDNYNHIYVQVIGAGGPRRITNASGDDIGATWSRDGRYIAFGRYFEKESGIYLVPALGGAERRLHDVAWVPPGWSVWGVDWSKNGDFVVFPYRKSKQGSFGIYSVSIGDLKETQLTAPPEEYPGDWHPTISPDGQTFAFIRVSTVGTSDIFLLPVLGGQPRRLTFDNKNVSGLAWTADGREIVFSSNRGGSQKLWRIPVSGGASEPLSVGGDNTIGLAISAQGNRLAYEQVIQDADIWRVALPGTPDQRTPPIKFISSSRQEGMVQYSPDGRKIVFWSERSGSGEIWVCDGDGSNPVQLTKFGSPLTANPHWSPDGKQIAFDSRPNGLSDVFVVNADGGAPRAITTDASEDGLPDWSRDGRWLYFASSRTGSFQVWKAPAEGGEAVQVTKQGGYIAHESSDGKYVYYCKQDTPGIWMVPAEGGEETLLTNLIDTAAWNWTVVDQGIYFVSFDAKLGSAIEFFSLATRKVTRIDRVEKFIPFWSGLSVSPNRKWALYSQIEQGGTDLMLVENFR
jgi:Tol biopolymer transport system component